jgi:hypothetical protein
MQGLPARFLYLFVGGCKSWMGESDPGEKAGKERGRARQSREIDHASLSAPDRLWRNTTNL